MINVTVWNENYHEQREQKIRDIYPKGIHGCIAEFLAVNNDICVRTATLDMPDCGLTDEILNNTDVLIWWAHCMHSQVPDELVEKIHDRVLRGMGLIVLHSGHHSKIFKKLMGQTGNLSWRDGDRERLWNILPSHPITEGIGEYIELDREEMYGEPFDIPQPDELIFLGWFSGGEVFRSGCTWHKKNGKVFYFQPGHESNPTYYKPEIQKIITNAVRWAAPTRLTPPLECPHVPVSPEAKYAEQHK
ncbi:MAG: trehalose utilization protein ThuA [Ruminococcaceae bacterium]|nr:trehalose utilization protein ThuA [Oscillospiraceae bacterium]